jgi:hypothetical protein
MGSAWCSRTIPGGGQAAPVRAIRHAGRRAGCGGGRECHTIARTTVSRHVIPWRRRAGIPDLGCVSMGPRQHWLAGSVPTVHPVQKIWFKRPVGLVEWWRRRRTKLVRADIRFFLPPWQSDCPGECPLQGEGFRLRGKARARRKRFDSRRSQPDADDLLPERPGKSMQKNEVHRLAAWAATGCELAAQ